MFGRRMKSNSKMKLSESDQTRYSLADGRPVAETKKRKSKVKNPSSTVAVATPDHCPKNPKHTRIRVYEIVRSTAFCVCDGCGATWQTKATLVEDLLAYCLRFAASLDAAKRIPGYNNDPVIIFDDRMAREISKTLRRLVSHYTPPPTAETTDRKKTRKT